MLRALRLLHKHIVGHTNEPEPPVLRWWSDGLYSFYPTTTTTKRHQSSWMCYVPNTALKPNTKWRPLLQHVWVVCLVCRLGLVVLRRHLALMWSSPFKSALYRCMYMQYILSLSLMYKERAPSVLSYRLVCCAAKSFGPRRSMDDVFANGGHDGVVSNDSKDKRSGIFAISR